MQDIVAMSNLTPNDYVLLGFVGFWGLVGVGTIATVLILWMKDRRPTVQRTARTRRRRRE